ncbi:type III-B CRISPR module RAMP protein Cmr4 [Caminibacter sp.]
MHVKPFFIKAITSLHVGSGSDLGVVDMPIQREAHTGFPKIEASSLKGAIRSAFESKANNDEDKKKIHIVFGCDDCEKEFPEDFKDEKKDFAGALGFSDARILFFPVKSVRGVFAYITCPMVLKRLKEDLEITNNSQENEFLKIKLPHIDDESCLVFSNTNTIKKDDDYYVVLEEYSFKSIKKINFDAKDFLIPDFSNVLERLVIISDDNFAHFVKNSTEVITRIAIDNNTGVVKRGGLFTEEYLPSETVMYSLAIANKPNSSVIVDFNSDEKVMEFFENKVKDDLKNILQIGGNTTLGKGIVEMSISIKQEEQTDGN